MLQPSPAILQAFPFRSCSVFHYTNHYRLDMANYALKFIKLILNGEARTVDVKHEAEVAYTAEMQAANKNTVWAAGCGSWYWKGDGWNSTTYPYTQLDFWRRCTFPQWDDWNIAYTSEGVAKRRRTAAVRTLTMALAVIGAYKVRQNGLSVKALMTMLLQRAMARLIRWAMLLNQRASA